jgi:acetyltransferase
VPIPAVGGLVLIARIVSTVCSKTPPDIRKSLELRDTAVTIRTLMPEDAAIEAAFVRNLSDRSRYFRFHAPLRELTPTMLSRLVNVSYPDSMALIATINVGGTEQQIGVARYARCEHDNAAEVAIAVADEWQGCGLGTRLLRELRNVAVAAGYTQLHMVVLAENKRMLQLARELGFSDEVEIKDYVSRQLAKSLPPSTS